MELIYLTGMRFGAWTVIRRDESGYHTRWICRCDCGTEKSILSTELRRGATKSCGCMKGRNISQSRIRDVTGMRFGRLIAVERDPNPHRGGSRWLCRCDCGNEVYVTIGHLTSGHTQSCGCYQRERTSESSSTHRMTDSAIYHTWKGIKSRCYNPNNLNYARYGGRGIEVCDEWRDSAEAFIAWALDNGWESGLSLDRIDNDGPYCPSNCRWASQKVQCNNTSKNVCLEHGGETHTISEWSEITGLKGVTIAMRLRRGWSVEDALTKPIRPISGVHHE